MRASVILALTISALSAGNVGHAQPISTGAVAAEPAMREATDAHAPAAGRLQPVQRRPTSGARASRIDAPSPRNEARGDTNLVTAAGCIVGEMFKGRAVVNAKSQCLASGNLSAVTRSLHSDADDESFDDDAAGSARAPGTEAVSRLHQRSGRRQSRKADASAIAAEQAMRWARQQLPRKSRSPRSEPADDRTVDLLVCRLSGRCNAKESPALLAANETPAAHRPMGARASGANP